jgi:hypothetical protein
MLVYFVLLQCSSSWDSTVLMNVWLHFSATTLRCWHFQRNNLVIQGGNAICSLRANVDISVVRAKVFLSALVLGSSVCTYAICNCNSFVKLFPFRITRPLSQTCFVSFRFVTRCEMYLLQTQKTKGHQKMGIKQSNAWLRAERHTPGCTDAPREFNSHIDTLYLCFPVGQSHTASCHPPIATGRMAGWQVGKPGRRTHGNIKSEVESVGQTSNIKHPNPTRDTR